MISETLLYQLATAISGVTILVALAMAAATRPRRPEPGAPTTDLGPEPPAVANLLTNGFEVTTEGMPATLLDLAARRWVEVKWIGEQSLLRPRRQGHGALSAYDEQVLEHLEGLSEGGMVPGGALTTGPEAASKRWWRRFARNVIREARGRGLCHPRWGKLAMGILWTGLGLAISLVAFVAQAQRESDVPPPQPASEDLVVAAAGAILVLFVLVARLSSSLRQRETAAGLDAAGRWLGVRRYLAENDALATRPAAAVIVWDQYLAYAAAFGLAPRAVRELPLGAEDDRRGWSRATGRWRPVRIRYPSFRVGWGRSPMGAIALGLLRGTPAAVVAWFAVRAAVGSFDIPNGVPDGAQSWIDLPLLAVAAAAVLVAGWQAALLAKGVGDLGRPRDVEGVVVRRRIFHESPWAARIWGAFGFRSDETPTETSEDSAPPRYWLAVDPGKDTDIRGWRVRPEIYARAGQGDRVRAAVTPRLGFVERIEVVERAPEVDVSEGSDLSELTEGAIPLPEALLRRVRERLEDLPEEWRQQVADALGSQVLPANERSPLSDSAPPR